MTPKLTWTIIKWVGAFIKQNFAAIVLIGLVWFGYHQYVQRMEAQRQEIIQISERQEFQRQQMDAIIDNVKHQIELSTAKYVAVTKKELKPVIKEVIPDKILKEIKKKNARIVELEKKAVLVGGGDFEGHAVDNDTDYVYKDGRLDFSLRKEDLFAKYSIKPIKLQMLQYKTINKRDRSITVDTIAYTETPDVPVKTLSSTYYVDKEFAVPEPAHVNLFSNKHIKIGLTVISVYALVALAH